MHQLDGNGDSCIYRIKGIVFRTFSAIFTFLYLNVTDLRDMNYFGNTEKST